MPFASHLGHQKGISFVPKWHEFTDQCGSVPGVENTPFPSFLYRVMDSYVGQMASPRLWAIEPIAQGAVLVVSRMDEAFNMCAVNKHIKEVI